MVVDSTINTSTTWYSIEAVAAHTDALGVSGPAGNGHSVITRVTTTTETLNILLKHSLTPSRSPSKRYVLP